MFENLRNELSKKRISNKAVADLIGCTQKTLDNKLNGVTEFTLGSGTTIKVHGEGGLLGRFAYNATSGEILAGTIPQENTIGKTADGVFVIAAHDTQGHVFPYPQAGTRPEVNTIGAIANASAQTGTDGKATAFSYSPCTDENLCGSDEI